MTSEVKIRCDQTEFDADRHPEEHHARQQSDAEVDAAPVRCDRAGEVRFASFQCGHAVSSLCAAADVSGSSMGSIPSADHGLNINYLRLLA